MSVILIAYIMKPSELYRKSDEVLGPYLLTIGFRRGRPGEYLRPVSIGGEDRIIVSKGPPSRQAVDFAVFLLSYFPEFVDTLRELFNLRKEASGFPCGPYLNAIGASQRPKYWSYRDEAALTKSPDQVLKFLQLGGVPWLERLRDPKVFAANVDPMAVLPAAIANEIAGNIREAQGFYADMLHRYRILLEKFGEKMLLEEYGRPFIYVATKLDVENDLRERFKKALNYNPKITALT